MPGKSKSNTNQTVSKKNLHRMASNNKAITECFNTPESIFGRVIRLLGNSRISVALDDESIVQATIRGLLRSKSTKIDIRDIVILEKDDSNSYYVIGVITDRKDTNRLVKEDRIPKWFLTMDLQVNETSKRVDTSKIKDSVIFEDSIFEPKESEEDELLDKFPKSYDMSNFGSGNQSDIKELNVEDI